MVAGILWGQFALPRDGNLALDTLFTTLLSLVTIPFMVIAFG